MADILGIGLSTLTGGLTGVLGAAVQRFADYKNKKLDIDAQKGRFAHEVEMRRVDAEIMEKEYAGRLKVAETEGATAMDVAASTAFAASLTAEPQRFADVAHLTPGQNWMMVGLDTIRGIVRPGLTLYLCVLTTLLYFQARSTLAGVTLDSTQALSLTERIVEAILYLFTTATLWYFGTRNKQPVPVRR